MCCLELAGGQLSSSGPDPIQHHPVHGSPGDNPTQTSQISHNIPTNFRYCLETLQEFDINMNMNLLSHVITMYKILTEQGIRLSSHHKHHGLGSQG